MELTKIAENNHYFFVAGTGILPFIDFFDQVLKYVIYKVCL